MIKAVIFDLDNTLLDFMKMKENAVAAAAEAMLEAGLDLPIDEVVDGIHRIYDEKGIEYQLVFDEYLQKVLGKIDYKILASGVVSYRKAKEASLVLYPRVKPTLMKLLKMGLNLGVISDAPSREAWMRICQLNLHHIFDVVITFDDTGKRKPSPEPFLKALELLGTEPREAIMVGDWAERDMVGAAKIGMKTAFARYGDLFGTGESGADYDLNSPHELIRIIEEENAPDRN